MYNKKTVTVVLPAYNEEDAVPKVIADIKKQKIADEILVVDNNSNDRTRELALKAGARVVAEKRQGYGFALRRGIHEAKGDIIILMEADNTFYAEDIQKLLVYIENVDLVLGTRTTHELIEKNANMGWFLKNGNLAIAKLLQLLWWGRIRLTDVGCTFRAIRKDKVKRIEPLFTVGGSHFSPDMILSALLANLRIVEIPVRYKERVGTSKITGSTTKAMLVGLRMIWLIAARKVESLFR